MSDLSVKLAALKGTRKTSDLVAGASGKFSRETFRKIERGESVKLSTLREIATTLRASKSEWLELVAAWLKTEAATDAKDLWIEVRRPTENALHDAESSQTSKAISYFHELNNEERLILLKTMQRPEVRNCLPAINRVWEKFANDKQPKA